MSQAVRTELLRAEDMVVLKHHDDDDCDEDYHDDYHDDSPRQAHRFSDDTTLDIPLPKVDVAVLKKVIEFCDHYLTEPMTEIERPLKESTTNMEDFVQKWYAAFVDVEQDLLFGLILAAGSMEIEPLLDLTCLALHNNLILGKMGAEITRVIFCIIHQEDG